MSGFQILTFASQQALDTAANVLSGATMTFSLTGVSTPTDAYANKELTIPLANPLSADAAGNFVPVFLNPAIVYRVVLKTQAGAVLKTWDPANENVLASVTSEFIGLTLDSLKRTDAEIAAGVTPVNYAYSARPFYDITRYGAIGDGLSASAATNSTAIQAAINVAYAAGGGVVWFPAGTYYVDAVPIVYNTVSIMGSGRFTTFIKKTTAATPSTVSDNSVRFWDSATVGFPVCGLHFVHHDGVNNWADGFVSDICVLADTESPNTTTTEYGFFFRGMTGANVFRCYADYVKVGFFWGHGATITSSIYENQASNTQRAFYQEFCTSTPFFSNYANRFRYQAYHHSGYYSDFHSNAADNVGAPWKVGTTEISLGYWFNSCRGSSIRGNGCETHNGSVYKLTNCTSIEFSDNMALDITSNYTGGSDICLFESDGNVSLNYHDNRLQTTSVTGTGARHFMWKTSGELGSYNWQRNRFVASFNDGTDTSTWANTSGTLTETFAIVATNGTFTPVIAGSSTAGATTHTTQSGSWKRNVDVLHFRLRVDWSAMTGTGNLLVTGLPVASANTNDTPVSITASALTFSGQLVAMVRANSTTIDLYSIATGAAATAVGVDSAATLWISGSYQV